MPLNDLILLAKDLGVPGLLIGLIYWMETNNRKDRREQHRERIEVDRLNAENTTRLTSMIEAVKTVLLGRHV